MNIKVNSAMGLNFAIGLANSMKESLKVHDRFDKFIKNHGYTAWHINNGWLRRNDNNDGLQITWIPSQAGNCHSFNKPLLNDKIIVIPDDYMLEFPCRLKLIECEVIGITEGWYNKKYYIKPIGIKYLSQKHVDGKEEFFFDSEFPDTWFYRFIEKIELFLKVKHDDRFMPSEWMSLIGK